MTKLNIFKEDIDLSKSLDKMVVNQNTDLFNKINEIALDESAPSISERNKKVITYFTAKPSKNTVDITGKRIAPPVSILMSGKNFKEKYMEHLESIIYNGQEELNPDMLIDVCLMWGYVRAGWKNIPVKLVGYNKKIVDIVFVLNLFYHKNRNIIDSIYTMIDGTLTKDIREPTKEGE